MGLRFRIFLGMMTVVVCALMATGYVAYRHGVDAEGSYNAQRLLRKEAALQRSLSYMLERLGGEVDQDSLATVFTDRICELADVHSLTFSLYNREGQLVTTSLGPGNDMDLRLSDAVLDRVRGGDARVELGDVANGTEVVWPLLANDGALLALGHVHYDPRESEEADWRAFLARLAPVYLLLFVLVGLLAFSLANSIVRPLRKLSDDMKLDPLGRSTNATVSYRWRDEIGALVDEYNHLLTRLAESMEGRAKLEREGAWREMAQQVAHEIKNPLTPLKLGAQHLRRAWEDQAPDFDERLARYTQTTTKQIDALSDIAEGFALLANDGLGTTEVLDLGDLLQDVTYLCEAEGVTLSNLAVEPALVRGDRTRLTRAFNNLVRNGLESNPEGEASVAVTLATDAGGAHTIEVKDNGKGIEPERLPHIFEPKFTTKTHGLGLGLAMVRAIVEGSGGAVSVKETSSSGTVFEVRLPAHSKG